jgi:hypothetical protein
MPTENNKRRVRQAVERSTPPLPPEVRKRALWAVMEAMRRGPPRRTAILVVLALLVLAAAVYAVVRWCAGSPEPGPCPKAGSAHALGREPPVPPLVAASDERNHG